VFRERRLSCGGPAASHSQRQYRYNHDQESPKYSNGRWRTFYAHRAKLRKLGFRLGAGTICMY